MREVIISFCIGAVIGFSISTAPFSMQKEMDHTGHEMIQAANPIPTITLDVTEDMKDGYNLHIKTENFTWSPEKVNAEPTQGQGHVHVYINNEKVARLYSPWMHIPSKLLKKGENILMVTLNADNHSEWMHNGEHIAATYEVQN